jgi:hypothetical protein
MYDVRKEIIKQSLSTIIKDCFYFLKFYHLLNFKSINSSDFFEK